MLLRWMIAAGPGRRNQSGLTTIEYAIAGGLVTAGIVLAFIALGGTVGGAIERIAELF